MPTIMKLSELIKNIEYQEIISSGKQFSKNIQSIEYDSRKCVTNSLFVAIEGELHDGHSYIGKAIELGAIVIVCQKIPEYRSKNATYLIVENSRKTLAILSHAFYGNPSQGMQIFAITGTNGKTSTTHLLKQILEFAGHKTGLIGTNGIWIGQRKIPASHTTPQSLELAKICSEMKEWGVSHLVMEVSSHATSQHRTFGIDFNFAGFLNLSHDHLDYHGSMKEYARSKKILFDNLLPSSVTIVNADDKYSEFVLGDTSAKKITFSMSGKSEKHNIHLHSSDFQETKFSIGRGLHIISPLIGSFNVENLTMAILMAKYSGIEDSVIIKSIQKISPPEGRMQRIALLNGAVGVIDYAHTPDAMKKVLTALATLLRAEDGEEGRLICVFGCGGDRDVTKRSQMGAIAGEYSHHCIITNDNPRSEDPRGIAEDIALGFARNNYDIVIERRLAIKKAIAESKGGDIVLIAGKGHETHQIIGTEKIHLSDREEVEKYI